MAAYFKIIIKRKLLSTADTSLSPDPVLIEHFPFITDHQDIKRPISPNLWSLSRKTLGKASR